MLSLTKFSLKAGIHCYDYPVDQKHIVQEVTSCYH